MAVVNTKVCPQCTNPTLSIVEVGWKKHRVVGESPRGYRFSVLTVKVPTIVITCDSCDFEQHGYIYENTMHLEDQEVSVQ